MRRNATGAPRGLLEILVISLPILVASVQVYLSASTDLTPWKGGGFGMYTDPHPGLSRRGWLTGTTQGSARSIRLYPSDERLGVPGMRDTQLRRDLMWLGEVAREYKNFPSMRGLSDLESALEGFFDTQGHESLVADLFPRADLRLRVVEVSLSPDFERVEVHTIAERELWNN